MNKEIIKEHQCIKNDTKYKLWYKFRNFILKYAARTIQIFYKRFQSELKKFLIYQIIK